MQKKKKKKKTPFFEFAYSLNILVLTIFTTILQYLSLQKF